MKRSIRVSLMVALASTVPFAANPALIRYTGDLIELNDSGVGGTVNFTHNTEKNTLRAQVRASGLVPNTLHPQHIHGNFEQEGCVAVAGDSIAGLCLDSDTAAECNIPSVAENDIDGDGFLETVEGAPAYGPIILNLADPSAGRAGLLDSFPMSKLWAGSSSTRHTT